MRFFAMLDDNTVVVVEGDTWTEAADNEPQNTHWLFSEDGLREFIANAKDALKGESA